jgi:pimeloyl-ACP methyl ester carboxylesterase
VTDPRPARFGDLAADVHGPAGGPAGRPPLVLLHGLTYDRRQWGPLIGEVAALDPDRRAVAFDLPGHGDSARRGSYHIAEVAAVVHEAVTAAGLAAPVVVGHSLGGVIATAYGAAYPAAGVVNIDQPLLAGPFAEVLRTAEPVLRSPDWAQFWDGMLASMHVEELPPAAQELVRTATTPRQDLLLGYWDELITRPADELVEIRTREMRAIAERGVPYRYVSRGEVPPPFRSWLESVCPGVAVTVLEGSGHFPHLGFPAELAKLLVE